jgi:hypothetical protein
MEIKKKKLNPEQMLMETLKFDDTDLEANHSDYLTDRQKAQIHATHGLNSLFWGLTLLACLSLFVGVMSLATLPTTADPVEQIMIGFGGLILTALAVTFIEPLSAFNPFGRPYDPPVKTIEGRVRLDILGTHHQIAVGDILFRVQTPVFLAFKNGDPYRIYYVERPHMIVSAEWLRD